MTGNTGNVKGATANRFGGGDPRLTASRVGYIHGYYNDPFPAEYEHWPKVVQLSYESGRQSASLALLAGSPLVA